LLCTYGPGFAWFVPFVFSVLLMLRLLLSLVSVLLMLRLLLSLLLAAAAAAIMVM
jgi:hypothetical protein